jgi:FMN reductase [NAD(P)H]
VSLRKSFVDRFGIEPASDGEAPDHPMLARVLARRTHRRYTDRPVPDGLLDWLLAAALSASSKSDFQQATVIRVKDADKRAAIAQHFPAMPWIGTSPVFLVFCADPRRLEQISSMRQHPQRNNDLEGFLNSCVDAALMMQTFILCAEAVGLGCCPISVIRNQMPAVAEVLKLPDGVFPVSGLCLGYPSDAGFVSMRLPRSLILHTDAYDAGRLAAEIDAYDRRRNARHAVPREQQRNPKKFGQADFYGWSEDKARQAAEPEGAPFAAYLKKTWLSI